jgi:hypothetical protein
VPLAPLDGFLKLTEQESVDPRNQIGRNISFQR